MSYITALPARVISIFSRDSGDVIQCEGWLLKKQFGVSQGYTRRYFVLRASGTLSCSLDAQAPPTEQISLTTATISSNRARSEIHIDCESGLYHVKTTSADDFDMWMTAFRRFIHVIVESGTLGMKESLVRNSAIPVCVHTREISVDLHELNVTIQSLQDTVKMAKDGESDNGIGSQIKSKKEPIKDKERLRYLFRKLVMPQPSTEATEQYNLLISRLEDIVDKLRMQFNKLSSSLSHTDITVPTISKSSRESHSQPGSPSGLENTALNGDGSLEGVWYDTLAGPEEFVIMDNNKISSSELSGTHVDGSDTVEPIVTIDVLGDQGVGDEDSGSCQASDSIEVVRRTVLPAPVRGDDISLFVFLRKNIGKDLSTVSFPAASNEPLSLLQRLAEDLEYTDLLSQACSIHNPTDRICLVAAFAVSGFACTRLRSGRKPFTPMLGETFEDRRTRFIAEKVSNHPLIIASHAEGDGWEWWATSAGKNHFWGKSLEIEQTGTTHLRIGQDHYQWSKPSCFLRNLMFGTRYLEYVGSLSIENKVTRAKCIIEFKEAGFRGIPYRLSGIVYSPQGKIETRLEGAWHEQLSRVLSNSHLRVLWRANGLPNHASQYYGFTSFATTLNEITSDIKDKLPPTDTRYRPDLRALEEGNIALAEAEKARVEAAQRDRRNQGEEVEPKWFTKVGPSDFTYNGGYWEQRSKGWAGCQALW